MKFDCLIVIRIKLLAFEVFVEDGQVLEVNSLDRGARGAEFLGGEEELTVEGPRAEGPTDTSDLQHCGDVKNVVAQEWRKKRKRKREKERLLEIEQQILQNKREIAPRGFLLWGKSRGIR